MQKKSHNLSDLISVVSHYDHSTLITKNGELVQIIKVKGYSKRFNKISRANLRDTIRSLLKNLMRDNLMFYIYVKRDYTNIDTTSSFTSEFTQMNHDIWVDANNFKHCLMNTLYIAVVHHGAKEMFSVRNFYKQIFMRVMRETFFSKLDSALKEISMIAVTILQELDFFGVTLLSIVSKDDKLISEPLSFIYYLIHLKNKEVEIAKTDFANILTYNLSIANEYNTACISTDHGMSLDFDGIMNISNKKGNEIYTGVLTIKAAYDLQKKYTDKVLSLEQQMIITETMRLTDKKPYLDNLNLHKLIHEISNAQEPILDITKLLEDIQTTHCIKTQTSIKIFANTKEILNEKLRNTKQLLFNIGISTVREDYYMMGGYFASIPGNSHFLRRENYSSISNSACFASIKQKSLGEYSGGIWGQPVTIFKTVEGLPYFFNFHNKNDIGHTIIVGSKKNNPHLLRNFLIFESFKFDLKFTNFDHDGFDIDTLSLCGAKNQEDFSVDMFKIMKNDPDTICKLIECVLLNDEVLSDEIKSLLVKIIQEIITIVSAEKTSDDIIMKVNEIIHSSDTNLNSDIKHLLTQFFSAECFFKFFNNDKIFEDKLLNINLNGTFQNTDLKDNIKNNIKFLLEFLYVKNFNTNLDHTNMQQIIINIESRILNIGLVFADELMKIFEDLAKKHVVLIINCKNKQDLYKLKDIKKFLQRVVPTRFFLSDKFIEHEFKDIFELSHLDVNKIKMYNPSEHMFLLKQDEHNVIASFKICAGK